MSVAAERREMCETEFAPDRAGRYAGLDADPENDYVPSGCTYTEATSPDPLPDWMEVSNINL